MMKLHLTCLLCLLFAWTTTFSQAGNALHFDGTNDQVQCPLPSIFGSISSTSFTIEAWVYPTGAVFSRILYAQSSTTNFAALSTGASNQIYFYVVANGTNYSLVTTANMPQNQWTHVAVTWNAATTSVACYFNGVLQATSGGGSSSTGTSGMMTLGTRPGGAQYFPGAMDEVRIWSGIRSACEINSNMNRHFTSPQTNLVAYYDFNHGIAGSTNGGVSILSDYSGNNYNGTLSNFALTGTTSNWIASTAPITVSGNTVGGYSATVNATVCSGGSYTFPDASTQTNITAPLTQTSTIPGPGGCDTVITTNLAVNATYAFTDTVSVCGGGSVTFPDGSTISGIFADTSHISILQSSTGCDSVYDTHVSVLPIFSTNESVTICPGGSVTYPDGSTDSLITQPISHISILSTIQGCDSLVFTSVSLLPSYNLSPFDTVCTGSSYTFPDGFVQTGITIPVSHTSLLQTTDGCDSTIVTTVIPRSVQTGVAVNIPILEAQAQGATFQWIDCMAGNQIIPGETNAIYNVTATGVYAVIVSQFGCSDTSACISVFIDSRAEAQRLDFLLHPNPNDGRFTIDLREASLEPADLRMFNALGQEVFRTALQAPASHTLDLGHLAKGIYTLSLRQDARQGVAKVVVD